MEPNNVSINTDINWSKSELNCEVNGNGDEHKCETSGEGAENTEKNKVSCNSPADQMEEEEEEGPDDAIKRLHLLLAIMDAMDNSESLDEIRKQVASIHGDVFDVLLRVQKRDEDISRIMPCDGTSHFVDVLQDLEKVLLQLRSLEERVVQLLTSRQEGRNDPCAVDGT